MNLLNGILFLIGRDRTYARAYDKSILTILGAAESLTYPFTPNLSDHALSRRTCTCRQSKYTHYSHHLHTKDIENLIELVD